MIKRGEHRASGQGECLGAPSIGCFAEGCSSSLPLVWARLADLGRRRTGLGVLVSAS